MSSNKLCKACVMLEGLNKGLPKLAVGNSQMQKTLLENNESVGPILQNMKDLKISKEIKKAQLDF
jgi:cytoplasmic tRNA 2-thiolation protein 1